MKLLFSFPRIWAWEQKKVVKTQKQNQSLEGCQQENGLYYNTHAAEVTGKFNLTGQSVLLLQDRGLRVTVVLIKLPYISVCFLGKLCIDPV